MEAVVPDEPASYAATNLGSNSPLNPILKDIPPCKCKFPSRKVSSL